MKSDYINGLWHICGRMTILVLLWLPVTWAPPACGQGRVLGLDEIYDPTASIPERLTHNLLVINDEISSHVQGVAVDIQRGYIYFSFTTKLIKTDLRGTVIGSVRGFTCHLGCLELDSETGRLYASVEYKDDAIGQGISGSEAKERPNTFYIGIFDTEKINARNIDAETGGVFRTVYLKEVVEWYEGTATNNGKTCDHVYGCSGVDGISLGPQFGYTDGEKFLCIALGIYKDNSRTDNDYQVLLQYRLSDLAAFAQPLDQAHPHQSGPEAALNRYFVLTGNTNYGVQNLEYDSCTHHWFMCVYKGSKSTFPNYCIYAIDGTKAPVEQALQGFIPEQKGLVLSLATDGKLHVASGVYGWAQNLGATGIESLGDGYFYISSQGTSSDYQSCTLQLYRWVGGTDNPFIMVE